MHCSCIGLHRTAQDVPSPYNQGSRSDGGAPTAPTPIAGLLWLWLRVCQGMAGYGYTMALSLQLRHSTGNH